MNERQQRQALQLHELHREGLFMLPNVWDALGAALVEEMGFKAVATASASISFTNGYRDGERLPFYMLLETIETIVKSTSLPLTVDFEGGYSSSPRGLEEKILLLLTRGVAGINIEDYDHTHRRLFSTEMQCERIQLIQNLAKKEGVPLFINARTDAHWKDKGTPEQNFSKALARIKAYADAGAHCVFVPGIVNKKQLKEIVKAVPCPVNVLVHEGLPSAGELKEIGIRRVSFGPTLLRMVMTTLKSGLELVQSEGNFECLIRNTVTLPYLSNLVSAGGYLAKEYDNKNHVA